MSMKLVVTAHPDDETIFMAGLILQSPEVHWKVICMTDGNADGFGEARMQSLASACEQLGVKEFEKWMYPDIFEKRLPVDEIAERLSQFEPDEVYTHGPLGEYGHPHHQDLCYASHKAFQKKCDVHSIAYNVYPEKLIQLSEEEFKLKQKLLSTVYFSETERFINLLPTTFCEGFTRFEWQEVQAWYSHLTKNTELDQKHIPKYLAMLPYLTSENNPFQCRL